MSYLDFELRIDELGDGRYRATVIDMPLGEGQAEVSHEFTLPFAPDKLERILAILSRRISVPTREREEIARQFGETLFKAVFAGSVYTVYFSSRDRARTADGLRVKLFLEHAGDLETLPWEFLRDPAVDYLALSRSTPLVRHPRRLVSRPRPALERPLRVLVMVSSPSDMPPVDVEAEWKTLQTATAKLRARGLLEMVRLKDASLRTLQRVLRREDYHVFHYIGHSVFEEGQGMLALEDPLGEGASFLVRGEDLARELSEENTIRLVVLNACQSAAAQENDPFAGIASSLVARGIPAVVAMQYLIGDRAALAFSEEFYRAVADGFPIDAAVSEARRAIRHSVGGIAWATPVLFMRAADGVLFEVRKRALWLAALRHPAVLAGIAAALIALAVLVGGLVWGGDGDPTPQANTAVSPLPTSSGPQTDLVIDEIEVSPARPAPGQKVLFIVRVHNNGLSDIDSFQFEFLEDVLDGEPSFSEQVEPLASNDAATIIIPHIYPWWGSYVSEVRIDSANQVVESDEFNNRGLHSLVIGDEPFTVVFDRLPDGSAITESLPVDAATFATWGFRVEAVPPADDPACADVMPWIIVAGGERYLGAGLPDAPDECTTARVALVLERSPVGRVLAQFAVEQSAEYSLAVYSDNAGGSPPVDRVGETFAPGVCVDDRCELEVFGGFLNQLRIVRAELPGGADVPTHITRLQFSDPVRTNMLRR
jgi:hypothetical protein